jgi:hypothetical protein
MRGFGRMGGGSLEGYLIFFICSCGGAQLAGGGGEHPGFGAVRHEGWSGLGNSFAGWNLEEKVWMRHDFSIDLWRKYT